MAKGMKIIAGISLLMTAIFTAIYHISPLGIYLSMAITAGTISYHFCMRLLVGGIFDLALHNQVNPNRKWFQVGKAEKKLYEILKVKKWKNYFPTYDPNVFDKRQHSWGEIAGAMCQAELVHETIAALSFLPILASAWFGAGTVFAVTSLCAALFDLTFVMIQRYNRPRVLKILNMERA